MPSYKDETNKVAKKKIENLLKELPPIVKTYIIGRENRLSELTKLSYCYKFEHFFRYLHENNSYFGKKEIKEITLDDLALLKTTDIEEFLHYIRLNSHATTHTGSNSTVEAYISCLNSFWKYYCRREWDFKFNPIEIIDRPRKTRKKTIKLDRNEKEKLLNEVEYGSHLNNRQQLFHEKHKIRDLAIFETFLDTGLRISELVGLNIADINFDEHYFGIIRKGGNYAEVYFSDYLEAILREYLDIRREVYKPVDSEEALFLSSKGTRISVRQVQVMTKKYTTASLGSKSEVITPHKLRATYATDMNRKTSNLRLVQEQLGHSNIVTTQIYAAIDTEDLKGHRNVLRDDEF